MKRTMLALASLLLAAVGGQALADVVVPLERTPLSARRTAVFWATRYRATSSPAGRRRT